MSRSASEFSTIITKTLIFKQSNAPKTVYFKRFNLYITIFYLPGPELLNTKIKMRKITEHTCYDDNGKLIFNKWFYRRIPTKL